MQPESPRRFTPLPPTPPRGRRLGLRTEDTWSYADIWETVAAVRAWADGAPIRVLN